MFKARLHKFTIVNIKLIEALCSKRGLIYEFTSVNIKLIDASCLKRGFISLLAYLKDSNAAAHLRVARLNINLYFLKHCQIVGNLSLYASTS